MAQPQQSGAAYRYVDALNNAPAGDILPSRQDDYNNGQWFPALAYRERLAGFLILMGVGILLAILSCVSAYKQDKNAFVIMYTLGLAFSIFSTFFFAAPMYQLHNMSDRRRLIATVVYVIFVILTYVGGLKVKKSALVIVSVIVQYVVLAWYSMGYAVAARANTERVVNLS